MADLSKLAQSLTHLSAGFGAGLRSGEQIAIERKRQAEQDERARKKFVIDSTTDIVDLLGKSGAQFDAKTIELLARDLADKAGLPLDIGIEDKPTFIDLQQDILTQRQAEAAQTVTQKEAERKLKEREIGVKEREQTLKEKEFDIKESPSALSDINDSLKQLRGQRKDNLITIRSRDASESDKTLAKAQNRNLESQIRDMEKLQREQFKRLGLAPTDANELAKPVESLKDVIIGKARVLRKLQKSGTPTEDVVDMYRRFLLKLLNEGKINEQQAVETTKKFRKIIGG
jgi:hypothetical protein